MLSSLYYDSFLSLLGLLLADAKTYNVPSLRSLPKIENLYDLWE